MSSTCITVLGGVRHTEGCQTTPHNCIHHSDRPALYSCARDADRLHHLSIWFYCAECGEEFLTDRGRDVYRMGGDA